MADQFDPYHKWLGIPPAEQPPNHYRLLGVAPFESDPDVIDAAANRQMAYLHQCAIGPQMQHSQKLLNEVSAARLCLLNPQTKARYDAGLKQAMQPPASGQTPAPPTRVVKKVVRIVRAAEPAPEPEVVESLIPGFDPEATTVNYRRRRGGIGAIMAFVVMVGLIGGGGWYFWNQQQTAGDTNDAEAISVPSENPETPALASTDNPKPPEANQTPINQPAAIPNSVKPPEPQPGGARPGNAADPRPDFNAGNRQMNNPGEEPTEPVATRTPTFTNSAGM